MSERCSLGSGNADEEEILVDETNNTDYEETIDPVTDDIAIEELSDLSRELSLNLVRRKRNNWSAKTLLHTLLQTAHLKCSPPRNQTLSRTTAKASSCLTFLDNFRVFDSWILSGTFILQTAWRPGQKANGAKVNAVKCYLWQFGTITCHLEELLEERLEQEWPVLLSFPKN